MEDVGKWLQENGLTIGWLTTLVTIFGTILAFIIYWAPKVLALRRQIRDDSTKEKADYREDQLKAAGKIAMDYLGELNRLTVHRDQLENNFNDLRVKLSEAIAALSGERVTTAWQAEYISRLERKIVKLEAKLAEREARNETKGESSGGK